MPPTRALIPVLVAGFAYGCAAAPAREAPQGAGTTPADRAALEQQCIRLLEDVREFCREGLKANKAQTRFRCLDARLELDRSCF